MPSPMSALLCALVGIGLVGVCLVVLSVSIGTSLPSLFGGEWSIAYTNHVVQPLLSLFSNFTLNKVLFLGLWGLAGLATYFAIEYGIRLFKSARGASHDIQVTPYGVVQHPGISPFFVSALWRAATLLLFLPLFALSLKPLLLQLSAVAPQVVLGHLAAGNTILRLLALVVQFSLLAHAIVVFLRLFSMRMRLFGDDPI